jgi:hypothetical protein
MTDPSVGSRAERAHTPGHVQSRDGSRGDAMKTSAVAWTPSSHARRFGMSKNWGVFFDEIKFPCVSIN